MVWGLSPLLTTVDVIELRALSCSVCEMMICVIALFNSVEDGVVDGVRSVDDAVFHEDVGIVVDDERGWHIALWNRVCVDVILCTNVENGVLLVREPLAA